MDDLRGFLKFQALILLVVYASCFTFFWVNAYTHNFQLTMYINTYGEAFGEGVFLFLIGWPVISVGLYLLVADGDLAAHHG